MGSAWTKENKGHWMEANLCERTQWRTTDRKENGWLNDFPSNAICSEILKLRNYQGTIKMLVLKWVIPYTKYVIPYTKYEQYFTLKKVILITRIIQSAPGQHVVNSFKPLRP